MDIALRSIRFHSEVITTLDQFAGDLSVPCARSSRHQEMEASSALFLDRLFARVQRTESRPNVRTYLAADHRFNLGMGSVEIMAYNRQAADLGLDHEPRRNDALLRRAFAGFFRAPRVVDGTEAKVAHNSLSHSGSSLLCLGGLCISDIRARGLKDNLTWVEPSFVRAVSILPLHFLTTVPSGWNPIHADWWTGLPAKRLLVSGAAAVHLLLVALASRKRIARTHWAWLAPLAVFTTAPALMLAGASLLVGPAFHGRFLLGSLPAYWLLIVVLSDLSGKPGTILLRAVILPVALLAVILPLHHDTAVSPLRKVVTQIVHNRKPSDVVLGDRAIGPQGYWELRRVGLDMPMAFLPATPVWSRFTSQPTMSERVWVFCGLEECNDPLRSLLREHTLLQRYGRYLALFEHP